ncbi:hypothetical protein [Tropicimonas sp. IMCC34043]|uniref:hypothetical protein n=1 Tax=Tropicimonas sp. IMCC34043 TaxID=2248760 RepID=UPI0013009785|nr:hypothetical protein [Tropicimonas sp. IMCC34043]
MPSDTDSNFDLLTSLANAAALDQRKWAWFLQALSDAAGGIKLHLFSQDQTTRSVLSHITHGYDSKYLDSFETYYRTMDVRSSRIARLPVGRAVINRDVLSDEEMMRTEFYAEWLRPQEDILGGGVMVLERGAGRLTAIGGSIRRCDRSRLEAPFVRLLQRLAPALQNAMTVSRTLGELALENRVLRDSLDPEISAILALDRNGRLHYTNSRGEKLCREGRVVQVNWNAQLRFVEPQAQAALARALHDNRLPEIRVSPPFFMPESPRMQYICRTTPLGPDDGPLPWIAPAGRLASDFLLLALAPMARPTPRVSRQPIIG